MAAEYIDADVPGLTMLLALVDEFWQRPTAKLAGEVRHWLAEYGLSPIARRRLQWSVTRVVRQANRPGDDHDPRLDRLDTSSTKERFGGDPRHVLAALTSDDAS